MMEYSENHCNDMPTPIKFAIYECLHSFVEKQFYLMRIKASIKVKKLRKMTTIWEDPYM